MRASDLIVAPLYASNRSKCLLPSRQVKTHLHMTKSMKNVSKYPLCRFLLLHVCLLACSLAAVLDSWPAEEAAEVEIPVRPNGLFLQYKERFKIGYKTCCLVIPTAREIYTAGQYWSCCIEKDTFLLMYKKAFFSLQLHYILGLPANEGQKTSLWCQESLIACKFNSRSL